MRTPYRQIGSDPLGDSARRLRWRRMAGPIEQRTQRLGGVGTAVRSTAGEGTPVVFVHGNPSSSFDWVPFMERLRTPAIAFDPLRGTMRCAQAVTKEIAADYHPDMKLGEQ